MDFKYIAALVISLVITLIAMPMLIPFLHKIKFGQEIRKDGPQSHLIKGGTPTMGGVVFILVPLLVLVVLDHTAFASKEMLLVAMAYVGYGMIGFLDDYIIVVKKDNVGLRPGMKFLLQSILAVAFYLFYRNIASSTVYIPLLDQTLDLGWLYFVLVYIMFTAESNAVNLTDGLDGLSAGTVIIAISPYVIFALLQDNKDLAMLLLAVVGALLGYLRYNLHPAKIFMGDTGSLALGGLLAATAMVLKQELLLVIIGGVFLLEVLSVVIQVTSYKLTKKRVFKMAPLHHHFELSGFKETQVVLIFWSMGLVFAAIGCWLGVM
ncbi:phospho-N-acetylmuramoyl-pentapeptide-transferase [Clostridiaceae bacterium DONG20-135]|uniref:Phospho-N-acetylmuramoyl-pentapeptide-transferase n=1 Tax=Copranaerobaculum intestinale TaxID=2692629 RepID=A0A6N8U592_9FIRM|nr:phospho-N-acetylmuramoyl-pentapeptide-transferase [Copranaerobaculum intestinale]MXQ73242.1 phospho-N-acetylmuramoyl-pentapeptide-transferase [Copranaerobaculum intestinale]